jgi:serine/threonine protein phosphatase PrpC
MSANSPEPSQPRPAGAQSILGRLKDLVQSLQPETPNEEEVLPTWDAAPVEAIPAIPVAVPAIPVAQPVETEPDSREVFPVAMPVDPEATMSASPAMSEANTFPMPDSTDELPLLEAAPASANDTQEIPAPIHCRICGATRQEGHVSCTDCGYYFTPADLLPQTTPVTTRPGKRIRDRYETGEVLSRRGNMTRCRGIDHAGAEGPVAVVVVFEATDTSEAVPDTRLPDAGADSGILSDSDVDVEAGATVILPIRPLCPSLPWERTLLKTFEQPALPRVLDDFVEKGIEYLIEEVPAGRALWDAWDDPDVTAERRFGWLVEIAEAVHGVHQLGAIFEGLRPDNFVIAPTGHPRFCDLADILPLPLPPNVQLRGSLYGAPELLTGKADSRADLYSFGALLYALHVGRELDESDFDRPGYPKPFVPRFPDIHPAFGRLMSKTFRREVEARFPTEEAVREDPSGFVELIRTLNVLRRNYDNVRLELAAWTTTGMIRSGNEDAFALLHACESRQDDLGESALVLLADGMGGYEAGEVAAALAIQVLRQHLVAQKPFTALAGASHFPADALSTASRPEGHAPAALDVEACKQSLRTALREANRQVFAAARAPGTRRRGMGCTAEAVFVNGRHVVVGHIGDSRTYHLHEGRLIQLTRDQTLVNRLVELGSLTEEEAETHPRRNELQQAVGGQPDVEPGLYSSPLSPGDWVVVCSDGLSNHVSAGDLKQMLLSEAQSAEMAARRLVNLANIEGAADNATVVVVRAT